MMITHAYVRYEDDRRCAVVNIGDVKGFKPDDDFKTTFYSVKWTDKHGEAHFYRARILLVGKSEDDLEIKMRQGRVRIPKIVDGSNSEDSDESVQTPKKKKKREEPNNALLDLLASKKRKLMQKGHEQQNSQLTAAQEEVARLSATVRQQEVELKELRALSRDLQRKLIDSLDSRQANSSQALPPALPAALSPPHIAEPLPQKLEVPDTADIGNGLRITTSAWQRIQTNPKDSLFVKDLMTAVWSPTELLGRSLQGKHCPRFPDRPRKEPLSPWKVSAIRECYKQRLEKKGLVPEMMPGALKQMNRFMVEKLSDIERMTKRATKELP